jgi:hypothetical protein
VPPFLTSAPAVAFRSSWRTFRLSWRRSMTSARWRGGTGPDPVSYDVDRRRRRRLDDRPPVLDMGPLQGTEHLRIAREKLQPQIGEPCPHLRRRQGLHSCGNGGPAVRIRFNIPVRLYLIDDRFSMTRGRELGVSQFSADGNTIFPMNLLTSDSLPVSDGGKTYSSAATAVPACVFLVRRRPSYDLRRRMSLRLPRVRRCQSIEPWHLEGPKT